MVVSKQQHAWVIERMVVWSGLQHKCQMDLADEVYLCGTDYGAPGSFPGREVGFLVVSQIDMLTHRAVRFTGVGDAPGTLQLLRRRYDGSSRNDVGQEV